MSLTTPPNDDSESNLDRLRYDSSSSGIAFADEISSLSTEDSPTLTVGEQDDAEPLTDTQAPNNTDAPSSATPTIKFRNAHNFLRCRHISLLSFLITVVAVAFACLSIYIGAYYRSPTTTPSTKGLRALCHAIMPHADGEGGLGRLDPYISHGAINGSFLHDPNRQVYPGTRERVLSQIKSWIDNPDATERILWLHGPAGVGKSAIAQTILHSYTAEKVPANFFFFHSDPDRNNGNRLFTTLARQFASSIPDIEVHITRSLIEKPDLPTKNVETQFQELIVRPFEALSNHARQLPLSDMVVVIDGVDECVDARLQERIINVIGNIATNTRVPLRFLISSRPEAHIQKTVNSFERHTLSIDLVECADADRDIEKYLKDEFDDIAKDQRIDPAIWPSQEIIQQLVSKASGQFLYASTVIKFVGDKGNSAKVQLDIILGLTPRTTTQAFAELDRLYTAILERQPDQEFLKTFLASFVAQDSIHTAFLPSSHRPDQHTLYSFCPYPNLRDGYGILMDLSEVELRIKLRKMRSLLQITPDYIGLHHRSFFEFLQDSSRSNQYHISTESAVRQHLMLVIDSLVRSASEALATEQSDYYPPVPELVEMLGSYPSDFDNVLSREDWGSALRPLLNFQDRLLNLPNFTIPRNECTIFHVVHRLLLSISYRHIFPYKAEERHRAAMPFVLMRDLREGFSSYFRRIKGMFDLMSTLRDVKPEAIAMKVRSWSEAQDLMDLISHIVNGKYLITSLFSEDAAQKATQLGVEIHTRVPLLPQSFLSPTHVSGPYSELVNCSYCDLEVLCRVWLISNFLDHRYILPVLGIKATTEQDMPTIALISDDIGTHIHHWRKSTDPSSNTIIFTMLKLARAIQYLHSMNIVLSNSIGLDDIYVDSRSRVRISPMELVWSIHGKSLHEVGQRYESNISKFGYFFCTMYFDTELPCTTDTRVPPYKPESSVGEHVWELVQRCLRAEDKPSIGGVVQEMESWQV